MFDLEELKTKNNKSTFLYWFKKIDMFTWQIYVNDQENKEFKEVWGMKIDPHTLTHINGDDIVCNDPDSEKIKENFIRFKETRPEYLVQCNEFNPYKKTSMINLYEGYLIGSLLLKCSVHSQEDDYAIDKIKRCLEWLRSTDFYTAPASTRFHSPVPRGLLQHTLDVIYECKELLKTDIFKFKETSNLKSKDVDESSAILVSAVHDWCKIGLYEKYMRNVKNENTGVWESVPAYRCKESPFTCFGHGVSSMFLCQKFFKLTTEEALAIRWHMGVWRVADGDLNELQQANEEYPLVHLIQFADQLSITKYAVPEENHDMF